MTDIGGIQVHWHRDGSGPPVVLLHGLGQTHRVWDPCLALAARFTLSRHDLPGHGETEGPDQPWDIQDLADRLATAMTAAGIERAHVVGTSLGGMAALTFAATFPHRVDRLVLCDTSPGLSDGAREALLSAPDAGLAHQAMARADLLDLAEEIHAPTLILCAEGAELAMREAADFLARSIPRGQLAFVPGARTDAIVDRPDWIVRVLLDFLGEPGART